MFGRVRVCECGFMVFVVFMFASCEFAILVLLVAVRGCGLLGLCVCV